ncbi:NaeI family type II restriction endonuclease [Streptomyces sp. NPDC059639]|uniref:NaeI family type II restriction endonuclease n=1 Tax=Streptomyces sp. NPDC059639 TaxID=3346891 RepID=UPI0036CBB181
MPTEVRVSQLMGRGQQLSHLERDLKAAETLALWSSAGENSQDLDDPELIQILDYIRSLRDSKQRFAQVLRRTIDQLLDGENTGRYSWDTLYKTERTHAGTLVEINLQREFLFADGGPMDYRIQGIDVDCKYSQNFGSWMIPPEAIGHLCLLVWADDQRSRWRAGMMRIKPEWLNSGSNRDRKSTITSGHRDKIQWLWPAEDCALPENVLLRLPPQDIEAIFASTSGQHRVTELFRRAQHRPISRNVVRTVAQQKDYMKRVRGNGGARSALAHEGILIMGDYRSHQEIAQSLGLPAPREGEFVSARVTPGESHPDSPSVCIDGQRWTLAHPGDQVTAAPGLPSTAKEK